MISFFKMFQGYCKVEISGSGKERFLNLCKNKKMLLWNLQRKEERYTFFVSFRAHKYLKEIGEKTNTQVKIKGKYGLPFFLYRHKKRRIFYCGILFCIVMLYVLSLFIWDIQITGTEKYTVDQIQTYLMENGISPGVRKKAISCPSLEEQIREDFEDTAWVSCDIEGTCLTVQVKESIDMADMEEQEDSTPNDIIALKDGTIESIVTRVGTPLVKKGMEVKKGDTLISGVIYYYNDYDEVLESSMTSADGDIKAKTEYFYDQSFKLEYYEKKYTGSHNEKYALCFGSYQLPFLGPSVTYERYDRITETKRFKIGNRFYLPISLIREEEKEYIAKRVQLTEEDAKKRAEEKASYYLKKMKEEGKEILDQNFQVKIQDGECRVTGKVTVLESIGKIRNIP